MVFCGLRAEEEGNRIVFKERERERERGRET
jgi:hypothetical protein